MVCGIELFLAFLILMGGRLFLGSPWGAGTFAGPDGSRQPSALEHEIARIQGKSFGDYLARITL